MKKIFAITMFGEPFPWIQQYIDHVQHLEKDGWYWKIFTPCALQSKGNVEIIPMNTNQFNDLVERKLGVRSQLAITPQGIPNLHITDFYVFSGVIFEDYLQEADYWGITNLDVVYGQLSVFFPDEMLKNAEVFSDDVRTINGVFCLFENSLKINRLFTRIPNWREMVGQGECAGCNKTGQHSLYGSDEYGMTDILRASSDVTFLYPTYYPTLSHDRLEQHVPTPKLELKEDGSLWELFKDVNGPDWEHARPFGGRHIPYFHFQRTKKWPL